MKTKVLALSLEELRWAEKNHAMPYRLNQEFPGVRFYPETIWFCHKDFDQTPGTPSEVLGKYFVLHSDNVTPGFIEVNPFRDLFKDTYEEFYFQIDPNNWAERSEIRPVAVRYTGTRYWDFYYTLIELATDFQFLPVSSMKTKAPSPEVPRAKKPQMPVEVHNDAPLDPAAIWEAHKSHKF